MAHKRPAFVLLGASMVEYSFRPGGWGAVLADLYSRKADILLRGYRGWNTRRARAALPHFLPKDSPESQQPALIVIFLGTNDAAFPLPSGKGQFVPIPEYKENLRYMCEYCQSLSDSTRVLLITPPPINDEARRALSWKRFGPLAPNWLDRTDERAQAYAQACLSVAEEMKVGVVDLHNAIKRVENWETECLSDGMHISPKGCEILVELLLEALRKVSLHWEDVPNDLYCEPHMFDMIHPFLESQEYKQNLEKN
ncbi:GDSL esterase/lipase At2g38180 [Selaginella moellendorffii]|uniref:GDSL esterase/lipase At2g38180 n=1 Tax=Selaginella moellendorffii TaxID=88036 RepID=UPI000D1D02F4|nr:GDSL esterase/lipase At2g38180 [Selaginella moellendorffii]|eukprot:XP_024515741.1 GDSL esterase/lipase At2g38180 [Selaginella moellendorffii]